jgi:Glycosyltransferase family 87
MRRSSLVPALFACAISMVWLNQGMKHSEAQDQAEAIAHSFHRAIDGARYVGILLYMRSRDEEIYYAVASAIRGLPYDHERLVDRGRGTPPSFDRTLPPEDGHWHRPYKEIPVEYNAALLPFVLFPSFLAGTDFATYARAFSFLMAALLLGAAVLAIRAQPSRGERERWVAMAWMLLGLGSLAVQRLDAVAAFLLALTLWAAAERRPRAMGFALGFATATKFLPVLLIAPLIAADKEAWALPKVRRRAVLAFVVTAAIGFAPMLFPPDSLLEVLRYHSQRGLEVEATSAVVVETWRLLAGTAVPATFSYGSFNMDGETGTLLARLATPITLILMTALTVMLARAPAPRDDTARRDRLALALLAGLSILWLSAKVFSPQYLTWGMPLVLAVSGELGKRLTWLFFAVLTATQIVLCGLFVLVVQITPVGQVSLCVRLGLLVAFAVVVVRGLGLAIPRPKAAAALDA